MKNPKSTALESARSKPKYSRMAKSYTVQEGKTGHYFNDKKGADHFFKTGKTLSGQHAR